MKKLVFTFFVMGILLVELSACSSGAEDNTLTVWAWDQNYNVPAVEKAAEIYNKANPDVTIEVVDVAKEEVEQTLHTSLATGTTEGLPDIALIEDYNAQLFLESYPGAFYPMTDAVDYTQFLPYKVAACTYEDETYCMPFDSGVAGLFYRLDIVEEAGYTEEDMENLTWDEYFKVAEDVYQKTGTKMLAFDTGNAGTESGLRKIVLQSVGAWYDTDGVENLTKNQKLIDTLNLDKEVRNADWFKEVTDYNAFVSAANTGEVASVLTGVWFINSIKLAEDQSGLWRVTQVPKLEGVEGATNYSNNGGCGFFIINGTGHEELASDFLATSFIDPEFYDSALVNQAAIGSYMPSYDSDVYNTKDEFFGGEQVMKTFSTWAEQVPSIEYGSRTYEIDDAIVGNMPDFISGKITAEELLQKVQDQVAE